jgi:hypothetical protein
MLTGQPERRFVLDLTATKAAYQYHLHIASYCETPSHSPISHTLGRCLN